MNQKISIQNLNSILLRLLTVVTALTASNAFAEIIVDMGAPIDPTTAPAGPIIGQPMTVADPVTGQPIVVPAAAQLPAPTFDVNGFPLPPAATPGAEQPAPIANLNADRFASPPATQEAPASAPVDAVASTQAATIPAPDLSTPTKIDLSKVPSLHVDSVDSDDSSEQVAVAVKKEKEPTCENPEMMAAIFPIVALNEKVSQTIQLKVGTLSSMAKNSDNAAWVSEMSSILEKSKSSTYGLTPSQKKAQLAKIRSEIKKSFELGRATEDMDALKASFEAEKPKMKERVEKFIAFRESIRKQGIRPDDTEHFPKAATSYIASYRKEKAELDNWAQHIDRLCVRYTIMHKKLTPSRTTASVGFHR